MQMIQREFPNYHPLLSIARIAHKDDAPLGLQFEAHKVIAKYVESELKSVEHKGSVEQRHSVKVSLFDPIDGEYSVVKESSLPSPDSADPDRLGNW